VDVVDSPFSNKFVGELGAAAYTSEIPKIEAHKIPKIKNKLAACNNLKNNFYYKKITDKNNFKCI